VKKVLTSNNININEGCTIESGFVLRGDHSITIAEGVIVGKNVSVYAGVTIGEVNKKNEYLIV
jgi:serine acetyltransferase